MHINDQDIYPMVKVQGGEIAMRDDRTSKNWTVDIKPFLLGKYPVTIEQYHFITDKITAPKDNGDKPVVNISWNEAILICNLLSSKAGLKECYSISEDDEQNVMCDWNADGYRLPTEAEWQHACRAGTRDYTYGELDDIAWYKDNSNGELHEVGRKQPNAWGLYDMLGNVWEWCWDLYDPDVYGTYRIFRGGSWAEEARGCGATCRRRSHPTFAIDDLGLRLARNIGS